MNQRQRAKFEERFNREPRTSTEAAIYFGRDEGYSAACQDEAEAVRGLVEALQKIVFDDENAHAYAYEALRIYNGEYP